MVAFQGRLRQCKNLLPGGLNWLCYFAGSSKSHRENSISFIFLESLYQVDMNNVVKSSKHFFRYFNTLETHSVQSTGYFPFSHSWWNFFAFKYCMAVGRCNSTEGSEGPLPKGNLEFKISRWITVCLYYSCKNMGGRGAFPCPNGPVLFRTKCSRTKLFLLVVRGTFSENKCLFSFRLYSFMNFLRTYIHYITKTEQRDDLKRQSLICVPDLGI